MHAGYVGRFCTDKVSMTTTHRDGGVIPDIKAPPFIIYRPITTVEFKYIDYVSAQSGYIGFGLYTKGNSGEAKNNLVHELYEHGTINKNIVTYNITFSPQGSCDGSYIQLGDVSE